MLLKGSKAKQVEPWMQELTGPDGSKLHGAGSARSEDWWKGLGNVLMGQGYLASKTKAVSRFIRKCAWWPANLSVAAASIPRVDLVVCRFPPDFV